MTNPQVDEYDWYEEDQEDRERRYSAIQDEVGDFDQEPIQGSQLLYDESILDPISSRATLQQIFVQTI